MKHVLPVVAGALLLAGYGVAEGWWSNRWASPVDWSAAIDGLERIPIRLGNWVGEEVKLTDRELAVGQIKGYWYRRYVQQSTNRIITTLVVCGRPGPIAAHSPEVCFTGAGYSEVGAATRRAGPARFENGNGEFWTASFRRDDAPLPDPLRVTWSWDATGTWEAPAYPRWNFARYPMLFKLYLVQSLSRLDDPDAKNTEDEFMLLLLPELQSRLMPSNERPESHARSR